MRDPKLTRTFWKDLKVPSVIFLSLQQILMKLRVLTKFGMINRAARFIVWFERENRRKRGIGKRSIRTYFLVVSLSRTQSKKPFSHFQQREEEEEHYLLPGGVFTTAEPRPNAYIPDDDSELPIPRPYGSLAPFKPTEPGSTMRHIRKPVIKPIEI